MEKANGTEEKPITLTLTPKQLLVLVEFIRIGIKVIDNQGIRLPEEIRDEFDEAVNGILSAVEKELEEDE